MKIQLDAKALRALVDSDPEFEAEIKRAVIGQILKTWSFEAVEKTVSEMKNEVEAIAAAYAQKHVKRVYAPAGVGFSRGNRLTDEAREAIEIATERRVRAEFDAACQEAIDAARRELDDGLNGGPKSLRERIEDRIDQRITGDIAREITHRVNKRVALIISGAQKLADDSAP